MYNCKFVSSNGNVFVFGIANNNVFDLEGVSGIPVNLGTSQGFSQVGETVETKSVKGKNLTVKGVIFKNIATTKNALKNIFSAFSSGKLYFEDKYYIDVEIAETPTISPIKNNGAFMVRLFAPFPFFKKVEESTYNIGLIVPKFRFPVNYSTPHKFGDKSSQKYINIINNGDLQTSFRIDLTTSATSNNITITNLQTFEFLKLNGTLNVGEKISVYRTSKNQLKAELIAGDVTTDIAGWIDDDSSLEELAVGDNLILATDDEGGDSLTVQITFNEVVSAVYET